MRYGLLLSLTLLASTGCDLLPQRRLEPTLHNPFPQLSSVAVLPFLNKSECPTVNGREFAEAYYNELQQIPGFDVVSVSTVEETMTRFEIAIQSADDVYKLGNLLGVDAVVVGAVNDFESFYPPRCALEVEWYAMNPCFHPIPPGYGLPWGTPAEKDIPDEILLETEMSLARAQMATQTPIPPTETTQPSVPKRPSPEKGEPSGPTRLEFDQASAVTHAAWADSDAAATAAPASVAENSAPGLPADWPDPRGLVPDGPLPERPPCVYSGEPVLRHTAIYNANDSDFTAALESYYRFQDDNRVGHWQHYMRRSSDFIRFCSRLHIWEMLSARGGAGESRVVWELPNCR